MFKIALAGRPNVGKTTLFNKLCSKNLGIVYNTPGVTRDRQEGVVKLWDEINAKVIDIAGIEELRKTNSSLQKQTRNQAISGILDANVIFFILDGKDGILDGDRALFKEIRKFNKDVIIVVNKIESKYNIEPEELSQFSKHFAYISAEHNIGFTGLLNVLEDFYREYSKNNQVSIDINHEDKGLQIAFVGRPNAGKSTIINKILNENRLITDEIPGTTRDSIYIDFKFKDQKITLIDTAGIRRRSHIVDSIEKMSVEDSFSAVDFANVCILVMDIENALEGQDLSLIQKIIDEGRILMLLFNKIDKIKSNKVNEKDLINNIKETIKEKIGDLPDVIFFTASGLYENNFNLLFENAIFLYQKWQAKIKTKLLNDFIISIKPNIRKVGDKQLKLKYISQVKSKPPLFIVYTNIDEKEIPESQMRYIKANLKSFFNLEGITIRLQFKKQ